MQLANCLLVLNEFKSSVPKKNITPAEAQFLVLAHSENAGQISVTQLKVLTETVTRSSAEEKQRLAALYINKHTDPKRVTVESIWPGVNAKLPETFAEVVDKDGKPVFDKDGKLLTAAPEDSITIAGVSYSREQLEKLVAKNVVVQEVKEVETESPDIVIKPPTTKK